MNTIDLNANLARYSADIRRFAEVDVQDLKSWRMTDIPGVDERFATALKDYHMNTAHDVCDYVIFFDPSTMRETLKRIIPDGLWFDEGFQGNLEIFIHAMEERVRHHGLETPLGRQVVMFKESDWEKLPCYELADMPGFNRPMERSIKTRTGIKNGRQLYEQFRALGQDSARMRAWLESHIPPECIIAQGMYSEGNLDHICLCLSERANRQNVRGEDPPAIPEVGVTRSGRQYGRSAS
jgi:hypothetical protein